MNTIVMPLLQPKMSFFFNRVRDGAIYFYDGKQRIRDVVCRPNDMVEVSEIICIVYLGYRVTITIGGVHLIL